MDSTREVIRAVLTSQAKLKVDVASLADDADLFDAGMTSFASVNVMLALEDAFDVEFPTAALTRDVFRSVNAIAAAVSNIQTTPV